MTENSDYSFEKDQNQPIWASYVDRETAVYSTLSGSSFMGVLRKPNFDSKFISLIPSIIFNADGEHAYVEREVPTRLPLQVFEEGKVILAPLSKGYLDEKVESLNRLADKKRGVLGFSPEEKPQNESK